MTRIAPVRMKMNPRTYWFDAGDLDLSKDQVVVVQTVRGKELATVADSVFEAEPDQICALKSPLKAVLRIATEQDTERGQEMERLAAEAMPIYRELVEETQLDMRPVSVEYLLDGDKAVFYFESEERIDFRDLVRKLASRFHVRVDMRQIGVRDEARMIGGLGHCGQELCCARMGGEFNPVSIRMAKEQDLSLNPQKISGTCGRLMCCLRYEYEAYKDFNARAPKKNASIQTPDGTAKVTALDVPREIVTIKLDDESGKTVKVPLSAFDTPEPEPGKEKVRPNSISRDSWNDVLSQDGIGGSIDSLFMTAQFTKADKVGSAKAIRNERTHEKAGDKKSSRNKRGKGKQSSPQQAESTQPTSDRKKRRRSTTISSNAPTSARNTRESAESSGQRVRPGQKSSGLRTAQQSKADAAPDEKKQRSGNRRRASKKKQEPSQNGSTRNAQPSQKEKPAQVTAKRTEGTDRRRTRRRSHKSGGPKTEQPKE